MVDPLNTLLYRLEKDLQRLGGASLRRAEPKARLADRIADLLGRRPPPSLSAFVERYDGGTLPHGVRLLSYEEAQTRHKELGKGAGLRGLWPVIERGPRLFALDAESADDVEGEWPVVEVADRSVDRVGTSYFRYLAVVLTDIAEADALGIREGAREPSGPDDLRELLRAARERCLADPSFGEHWADWAEALDRAGQPADAQQALDQGMRAAQPPGPALIAAVGLRALAAGEREAARAALEDALSLEPLTARDDDARLDAAAAKLVLALEDRKPADVERARGLLGNGAGATGAYWRGEAFRALANGERGRLELAINIVKALIPEDKDIDRLAPETPASQAAARLLQRAREALEAGDSDAASRAARAALSERNEWAVTHAVLAEALNGGRARGALEAALRATELNPELVDGWRELGDAYLDARDPQKAEVAYRQGLERDSTYSLLHGKRAQALLELGRKSEALQAVEAAQEIGGDAFFLAAVKGDVLSAMGRHRDAAEAYDTALRVEPENHWALHQAALEHGEAGNHDQAIALFEQALVHDGDGCHQTLVDYAELMRKLGRIGDAVRLYRRAVAAVPNDPEWRQWLREAEKELDAAPN